MTQNIARKQHYVRVVSQRRRMDCGIAVLAMLLGKPYGDISAVARQLKPKYASEGMLVSDLQEIATFFNVHLKRVYRKKDYLQGATGILGVLGDTMIGGGHFVILKAGVIVDPHGAEVWAVDTYLAKHRARPCTLLVVR